MRMVMKSDLKTEAEKITRDLRLLDLLSLYGKAGVVGSVAYDLIVKLDIDIHLMIPEGIDLLNTVDSIYHQLLDHEHVREVRISDYREDHAVKIGIDRYPEKSGDWSIDIWVTDKAEETAFEYVDYLRKALSPVHRKAILGIKEYYHKLGQLRDGMSFLIYGAVIDNDVRTVEEFKRFLAGKEASLRKDPGD
jgi:hypothetical protein